jgi:hypothetical protein
MAWRISFFRAFTLGFAFKGRLDLMPMKLGRMVREA